MLPYRPCPSLQPLQPTTQSQNLLLGGPIRRDILIGAAHQLILDRHNHLTTWIPTRKPSHRPKTSNLQGTYPRRYKPQINNTHSPRLETHTIPSPQPTLQICPKIATRLHILTKQDNNRYTYNLNVYLEAYSNILSQLDATNIQDTLNTHPSPTNMDNESGQH